MYRFNSHCTLALSFLKYTLQIFLDATLNVIAEFKILKLSD